MRTNDLIRMRRLEPAVMQSVYRHALTDHVSVTDLLAVSAFQNPFQTN